MKNQNKKLRNGIVLLLVCVITISIYAFTKSSKNCHSEAMTTTKALGFESKGCVFNTLFGETELEEEFRLETTAEVRSSLSEGLSWIKNAQHKNGGWGAGSHAAQNVIDPHAVNPDPATTAMVAMALLRCNNTLTTGAYHQELSKAVNYLLETVESLSDKDVYITKEQNTQIQMKLGKHIDAVLTAQFLTNLASKMDVENFEKDRIMSAIDQCVKRIQKAQNADGSLSGEGWAGVLQSAYANNALESAKSIGVNIDEESFELSKNYQKGNVNAESGDVKTEKGAGVMLYAVSGSTRASAKDARKAKEVIEKAKEEGKLDADAPVSTETLRDAGISEAEALKYGTAYDVYESANEMANRKDVLTGFGNNGGEEFLSFLQTGESMIINKDDSWKNWYASTSGNLLNIQNENGSWNGHHCITSPVFCTATCLLILSVSNDLEDLVRLGADG